jgi:hypothetical protein
MARGVCRHSMQRRQLAAPVRDVLLDMLGYAPPTVGMPLAQQSCIRSRSRLSTSARHVRCVRSTHDVHWFGFVGGRESVRLAKHSMAPHVPGVARTIGARSRRAAEQPTATAPSGNVGGVVLNHVDIPMSAKPPRRPSSPASARDYMSTAPQRRPNSATLLNRGPIAG